MNNKHLIKKIDFNNYLVDYNDILKKLEPNLKVELDLYKKSLMKKCFLYLALAVYSTFYFYWFIFIPLYMLSSWYLYRSLLKENLSNSEINKIEDKLVNIEFNKQLNNYQKEIGIINYVPQDLEYENLGLIIGVGNNYNNAERNLIKKAFELKADGIINVNLNSTSSTKLNGHIKKGNGVISSSVDITIHLQGIAIKLTK
ncbi:hypothetical protein O8C76_10315 [Aliarcobacter butzleri]|uniref:Uncharacterized protein n=1 Tax=Aliarcobacter butzleri TaxID=28197 RepID=A0AAW7Q0R5_9BACT|nr:hypothetical protein [Aliarcobacter butzleri]MDN5071413.1 hypothetical protein [Aliarcobacter butzleri]